jgi:hypothetical protein
MGDNWIDDLPTLELDDIKPFYDELVGVRKDAARPWLGDRKFIRRMDKKVLLDGRRLGNCLEHLGTLPSPTEAYHLITKGRYSLWHIIRTALTLTAPVTISRLTIGTLGFSQDNLTDLLGLLDSGKIAEVWFLYSCYFKSLEKQSCERLVSELTARGQHVLSCLTHCKLLVLEMGDGRSFVAESSANLRSCASIENIMFCNDTELAKFHVQWIQELFAEKESPR